MPSLWSSEIFRSNFVKQIWIVAFLFGENLRENLRPTGASFSKVSKVAKNLVIWVVLNCKHDCMCFSVHVVLGKFVQRYMKRCVWIDGQVRRSNSFITDEERKQRHFEVSWSTSDVALKKTQWKAQEDWTSKLVHVAANVLKCFW